MFVRVWRLRSNNPSSTSLIDARADEARLKGQEPRQEKAWVPLDRISPNLQRAVLAGEDTNFVYHRGFDYQAIQRAWEQGQREAAKEAKKEGEDDDWIPNLPEFKRGGSTISQQLAKNLFLSGEKTPWRKLQEAVITFMLEKVMSKRRILEIYLNVIEWGNGVFGAEAATRYYYGVSASSLSAEQSARLAAMIPNPRFYDLNRNTPWLLKKTGIILRRMPSTTVP
jgi:monofunctional biosynthetic peptidoglycan transglycosylase